MPFIPVTAVYSVLMVFVMYYFTDTRQNSSYDDVSKINSKVTELDFIKKIPVIILLLSFAELNGAQTYLLHIAGVTFITLGVINLLYTKISSFNGYLLSAFLHYGTVIVTTYLSLINLYLCWPYFMQF